MKKTHKSTITEVLAALVVLGSAAIMFSIFFSSCASTPQSSAPAEKPAPVKKKEYTKLDFMQELQVILNKDGPEKALEYFDVPKAAKYQGDFDIQFLKAAINVSAERLDAAQELCTMLSEKDPANQDVIALAAAIAKMKGDNKERSKQLNALLAQDKNNAAANCELASDSLMRKNYKQAKAYYKRALISEPKNTDALFGMGQCDYYLENDDAARQSFKNVLKIDPENTYALLYLGKLAYANDEYKEASDYAKRAIDSDPDNYDCHLDYGMYERYLGHFDNAIKEWTTAISIDSDYFLAYAYRAGVYDEMNKLDSAMKDYLKVVELNPQYYFAYENIGLLALHEEKWEIARNAFSKCFDKNPKNVSYPLMITYCYYMEKNDLKAKEFSDKALRKMDRNTIEYSVLRMFHDRAGEKQIAQRVANLTNRNQQGKMYYYLGLYYDMFGGVEAAKDFYSKVVELNSPMFFEYRLAEWRVKETKE